MYVTPYWDVLRYFNRKGGNNLKFFLKENKKNAAKSNKADVKKWNPEERICLEWLHFVLEHCIAYEIIVTKIDYKLRLQRVGQRVGKILHYKLRLQRVGQRVARCCITNWDYKEKDKELQDVALQIEITKRRTKNCKMLDYKLRLQRVGQRVGRMLHYKLRLQREGQRVARCWITNWDYKE